MKKYSTAVIIGFYKDDRYLNQCLQSLSTQTYKDFKVYLYDNSCRKGALDAIKRKHPEVIIRHNKKNLGFAGGNNSIIRECLGEPGLQSIVLLNDDMRVDPHWLEQLVASKNKNPGKKIGAIASKIIFYDDFVSLNIKAQVPELKFLSLPKFTSTDYNRVFIREGIMGPFYNTSNTVGQYIFARKASIDLPIGIVGDSQLDDYSLQGTIESPHPTTLEVSIQNSRKYIPLTQGINEFTVTFTKKELSNGIFQIIQNVGSDLTSTYDGYDIGSGEVDRGQYDEQRNVRMFCGGAVLLNVEALKEVGVFNGYFFNYYEDSDLSLRMQRSGWSIIYEPKALVRHIHSFSGVEWSDFFRFHVTRNRMVFASMNFGLKGYHNKLRQAVSEIFAHMKSALVRKGGKSELRHGMLLIMATLQAHTYLAVKLIKDRKNEDRHL